MSQRITDDMVTRWLIWCRNYGEIESYEKMANTGRKWKIVLPAPVMRDGKPHVDTTFFGHRPEDVIQEFVFTSREALVFAYGCAAGGAQRRPTVAREKWNW